VPAPKVRWWAPLDAIFVRSGGSLGFDPSLEDGW
jgi:hypothetical protein